MRYILDRARIFANILMTSALARLPGLNESQPENIATSMATSTLTGHSI
jgi:hypothetical protein